MNSTRAYAKPRALEAADLPEPFVDGKPEWTALSRFAWEGAFRHVHYRAGLPSPWYVDNACDPEKMWVWDTCFMSLYARYLPDLFPGIQALDNFYGWQREDGYISMTYQLVSQTEAYGERINPPLFAWAEWEYYRTTGRGDRIERVLPHLIRLFDWILKSRKCEHLELYWFEDGGSSGMDNSPRSRRTPAAGSHMGWVDLSSQLAMSALYISRLAAAAGQQGVADRFLCDWEMLSREVEEACWCPRSRFYHDRLDASNWQPSKTVAGFWPLLMETVSAPRLDALCAHLENPATFGRPCPVPSLAHDDPNYEDDGAYWLGGVWAPTNYMVFTGLCRNGRHELAQRLAGKYLDHLCAVFHDYVPRRGTIWEAYAPERAEPTPHHRRGELCRPEFTGWSALGPTACFYEHILGLEADAAAQTLLWRIGLTERHGIRRYPFAGGRLTLEASRRAGRADPVTVTAQADTACQLVVDVAGRRQTVALAAGKAVSVGV